MDLLRDAELTKLVRPARFGGFEYGLTELAQIAFELGSVCGSTGWCGSLAMCYQWMMSYFPLEAQQDVWSDPDNLVAGSYQSEQRVRNRARAASSLPAPGLTQAIARTANG